MKSLTQIAAEAVRAFALRLPGAVEDYPWGGAVAKVNKKIFVSFGHGESDGSFTFSMKLPVSHSQALTLPGIVPTGYGLGKHGWVTVTLAPDARPDENLLLAWVEESYRAIAPKKLVAQLDASD